MQTTQGQSSSILRNKLLLFVGLRITSLFLTVRRPIKSSMVRSPTVENRLPPYEFVGYIINCFGNATVQLRYTQFQSTTASYCRWHYQGSLHSRPGWTKWSLEGCNKKRISWIQKYWWNIKIIEEKKWLIGLQFVDTMVEW